MRVVIINGSPRGKNSNTRRCAFYIKDYFPEHDYIELSVGTKIGKLEKDSAQLDSYFDEIKSADVIIWAYPVYTFSIPFQLMRFIELIHERGKEDAFKGKYTTSISTSLNFYDHTAHNYMREECEDIGMYYFEGFSPSMFDLNSEELKQNLKNYAGDLFFHAEKKIDPGKTANPVSLQDFIYNPAEIEDIPGSEDKKILLITDAKEENANLNNMISIFTRLSPFPVEIANLNDINIKGGCLGCGKCMGEGKCVYKDDFVEFFKGKIIPADVLVYAASIRRRHLSSLWKKFYDRHFVNGHRPILHGRPVGYMISGPLRQVPNLRQTLDAHCEVGRTMQVGIVTDECNSSEELTGYIRMLADGIKRRLEKPWTRPSTFLGVGGHKIFRDLVYSLREFMVEDHRYYEENGLYDFPNMN